MPARAPTAASVAGKSPGWSQPIRVKTSPLRSDSGSNQPFPSCVTIIISPSRRYLMARRVLSLRSIVKPAYSSPTAQEACSRSRSMSSLRISNPFRPQIDRADPAGREDRQVQGRDGRLAMAITCLRRSFPCGGRDASGSFRVARVRDDRPKGEDRPRASALPSARPEGRRPKLDGRPLVLARAAVLPRQKLAAGRSNSGIVRTHSLAKYCRVFSESDDVCDTRMPRHSRQPTGISSSKAWRSIAFLVLVMLTSKRDLKIELSE